MSAVTYFILYLVSIISPLLAIAEPLVILSAMSGRRIYSPWLWSLPLANVRALQSSIFRQVLARLKGLKRKLDDSDFTRFERSKVTLTALSGIFGMPPASILAAAGNIFEPSSIRFLGVLFSGRLIRFGVLGAIPSTFVTIFKPELIPDWVNNLF